MVANPILFQDGVAPGDIVQGALGGEFFVNLFLMKMHEGVHVYRIFCCGCAATFLSTHLCHKIKTEGINTFY